jgi:hypothetical protein
MSLSAESFDLSALEKAMKDSIEHLKPMQRLEFLDNMVIDENSIIESLNTVFNQLQHGGEKLQNDFFRIASTEFNKPENIQHLKNFIRGERNKLLFQIPHLKSIPEQYFFVDREANSEINDLIFTVDETVYNDEHHKSCGYGLFLLYFDILEILWRLKGFSMKRYDFLYGNLTKLDGEMYEALINAVHPDFLPQVREKSLFRARKKVIRMTGIADAIELMADILAGNFSGPVLKFDLDGKVKENLFIGKPQYPVFKYLVDNRFFTPTEREEFENKIHLIKTTIQVSKAFKRCEFKLSRKRNRLEAFNWKAVKASSNDKAFTAK